MPASSPEETPVRFFSWRKICVVGVLGLIAAAGYFFRDSRQLNSLVGSGLNSPSETDREVRPDFILRVTDPEGQPVPAFQIQIRSPDVGGSDWIAGTNGQLLVRGNLLPDGESVDIAVRSDAFASTFVRFDGSEREQLLRGAAEIRLHEGALVELRFRLPDGTAWPDKLLPAVGFADHQDGVRVQWQPSFKRSFERFARQPDFSVLNNVLNVTPTDPGRFTLRLADDQPPFYVAVHHPGFIQFFERGPLTLADVTDGVLEIEVPQPAVVDVDFDPGVPSAGKLPFDTVTLKVLWNNPHKHSWLEVASQDGDARSGKLRLADLAPGNYEAQVTTQAQQAGQANRSQRAHPGFFFDSKVLHLAPAETQHVEFRRVPLDPESYRGDRTARIRILNPDGSPAGDRHVTVYYYDDHYGYLEAYSGTTPGTDSLQIRRLTDRRPSTVWLGDTRDAYRIDLDNRYLGAFNFTTDQPGEEFTFRLPPRVGDVAPDFDLVNVSTGASTKLQAFRGQVVCLELWATWCGPCQPAMQKLMRLAAEKRDAWRNRVVIVPLSIDDRREHVSRHVERRGWGEVEHYWSGDNGATGYEAPVMNAFAIHGVPALVIINRDGKIAWQGHPLDESQGKTVATRIEELLKK